MSHAQKHVIFGQLKTQTDALKYLNYTADGTHTDLHYQYTNLSYDDPATYQGTYSRFETVDSA